MYSLSLSACVSLCLSFLSSGPGLLCHPHAHTSAPESSAGGSTDPTRLSVDPPRTLAAAHRAAPVASRGPVTRGVGRPALPAVLAQPPSLCLAITPSRALAFATVNSVLRAQASKRLLQAVGSFTEGGHLLAARFGACYLAISCLSCPTGKQRTIPALSPHSWQEDYTRWRVLSAGTSQVLEKRLAFSSLWPCNS